MMQERKWDGTFDARLLREGRRQVTAVIVHVDDSALVNDDPDGECCGLVFKSSTLVDHVRLQKSQVGDFLLGLESVVAAEGANLVVVMDPSTQAVERLAGAAGSRVTTVAQRELGSAVGRATVPTLDEDMMLRRGGTCGLNVAGQGGSRGKPPELLEYAIDVFSSSAALLWGGLRAWALEVNQRFNELAAAPFGRRVEKVGRR